MKIKIIFLSLLLTGCAVPSNLIHVDHNLDQDELIAEQDALIASKNPSFKTELYSYEEGNPSEIIINWKLAEFNKIHVYSSDVQSFIVEYSLERTYLISKYRDVHHQNFNDLYPETD